MISATGENVRFSAKHFITANGVEPVIACAEFAAPLSQFQGPQLTRALLKTPLASPRLANVNPIYKNLGSGSGCSREKLYTALAGPSSGPAIAAQQHLEASLHSSTTLEFDSFDFVERNLISGSIVQFCGAW